jgi:catechol 2,3-dioxygenase-like lactoylglutathione lyase family enzyme
MPIELNHTIVHSKDAKASAQFLADILGLPAPTTFYHFQVVQVDNGVSLDFAQFGETTGWQHYAFLVSEGNFDDIFNRIQEQKITYYATPDRSIVNQINHNDGGRGTYFEDPHGNTLWEIITKPYGSGN